MALYFIAVTAPSTIDEQVREWKAFMQVNYGCKVALKSPAHITLIPPFTLDAEQENSLNILLADFAGSRQRFPLVLQNFSAFAPRVIYVDVLPSAQLASLQKETEAMLISHRYPVKTSNRVFHPHVTIANRDLRKKDFAEAFSYFSARTYHAEFTAPGISLLAHKGGSWQTAFFASFRPEHEG